MYDNLADVGWTENQWSTVQRTVEEEAQKARIGRRFLPVVGPLPPEVTAVPPLTLTTANDPNVPNPLVGAPGFVASLRFEANTDPTLFLATISVLVELPKSQLADPQMSGALTMFRRAANYIARVEDAIIFNGQPGPNLPPPIVPAGLIPAVYRVTGGGLAGGAAPGLIPAAPVPLAPGGAAVGDRLSVQIGAGLGGLDLINAVIAARTLLEANGQFGPFHCIFSATLQRVATTPTGNLIMPLDRILPHLDGGSVFNSSIVADPPNPPPARFPLGAVVAGNGSPLELVVGSDICVKFLQTTLEPRWVFRVSERIAFRLKDAKSIAVIYQP